MQSIIGRYPVRNVQEMKEADNYFVAHKFDFDSVDRRNYAVELNSLTKEAGYSSSKDVQDYAGPRRSSIEAGINYRKINSPEDFHSRLDTIEKLSHVAPDEEVLHSLDRIDREIGLHRRYHIVPDPVKTMYASEKIAQFTDEVWRGDTDQLRQKDLELWTQSDDYTHQMKNHFPYDLVNGLRADPWPIFSSLPDPHKKIIARMCNDKSIGMRPEGQSVYDVGGALAKEDLHQSVESQIERMDRLHGTQKQRIISRLSRI